MTEYLTERYSISALITKICKAGFITCVAELSKQKIGIDQNTVNKYTHQMSSI